MAGLPEGTVFATKPELAADLVRSCLAAGHRPGWVAADEVYGNAPALREAVEAKGGGYVLAVSCSTRVPVGPARLRADVLARRTPPPLVDLATTPPAPRQTMSLPAAMDVR